MKNLITYGKIFDRKKFEEVRNEISFANKPEKGGLWCSPENSVYGWKDFCQGEDFRTEDLDHGTRFDLKEGTKLLVIDCVEDYRKAIERFGGRNRELYYVKEKFLNFGLIRDAGYDGVYLTDNGNSELHTPDFDEFGDLEMVMNTWDVESILILNPDCMENIRPFGK